MSSERVSRQAFLGVALLIFVASMAATILSSSHMSVMGETPMPGGWTMSAVWMRMPGQTWFDAATSFLGMWDVMMAAMMLPSLIPMLLRYRQAVSESGETHLGRLMLLTGTGYFFSWTVFGLATYAFGVVLAVMEVRLHALAQAIPTAAGMVILIAGVFQFTKWKMRYLTCCCEVTGCVCTLSASTSKAWHHGLRLGIHCIFCCFNLTVIQLVIGIMDIRAMAVVMAAITAERLTPSGERVAQVTGCVAVVTGIYVITRAAGLT